MPQRLRCLRDVGPSFPLDNSDDKLLAHIEQSGEIVKAYNSRTVYGAYLDDLPLCQLRIPMFLAFWFERPSFGYHIRHILGVGCEKQMRGIATGPVRDVTDRVTFVASVADFLAIWYRAVRIFPSKPVAHSRGASGFSCSFAFWKWYKSAIAMIAFIAKPWPALFRCSYLDLCPKSDLWVCFRCHSQYVT
jgi:hypothetical protein